MKTSDVPSTPGQSQEVCVSETNLPKIQIKI